MDIKNVLSHELAPIPTCMLMDTGEMRISKAKSVLKNQLQVEVFARTTVTADVTIIDGSALLWVLHWHSGGSVQECMNHFLAN